MIKSEKYFENMKEKTKNFLLILPVAIVGGFLMIYTIVMLLFACSINSGRKYGPYHHQALINVCANEFTLTNGKYVFCYGKIYKAENGSLDLVSIEDDTGSVYVTDIDVSSDGAHVFIADGNGIYDYSSDFNYLGKIIDGRITSLLVCENYIYYFSGYGESRGEFRRYDLSSSEDVYVNGIFTNEVFIYQGKKFYSNNDGYLFLADAAAGKNFAKKRGKYNKNSRLYGFCFDGKAGSVEVGENIKISYNGKDRNFPVGDELFLYDRITVRNGKLLFATRKYVPNGKCNDDDCICHIGGSALYRFDFETDSLETVKSLNAEEFFISFDNDHFSFYRDGNIYRGDEKIKDAEKISARGEFKQFGRETKKDAAVSLSVFYDDGSDLYYRFFDYSEQIKDEYF